MAKTTSSNTVPADTSTVPATSIFGDLLGVIDSGFDRYIKYDQYKLGRKTVQLQQEQTQALRDLADAELNGTSTSTVANDQLVTMLVVGGIALAGIYLLAKG